MGKPIKFKPFEHQQMIIDHITSRTRSIVFAGMGLGKTSSILKSLYDLRFRGKITGAMIVSPLRVTNLTWPMEIMKWKFAHTFEVCKLRDAIPYAAWLRKTKLAEKKGTKLPYLTKAKQLAGKKALKMWNQGNADIYLVNYELIQQLVDELIKGRKDIPCNAVVFDEISLAKNPSSKRIQQFRKISHHFDIRIGLTGTLLPNGYLDVFAPTRLLDDGESLGKYITKYKDEYFYNPDKQGFKWLLRKGSKEKIEEKISHLTITLSSEDYLDIPDVAYKDVIVKMPAMARKQYIKLEKEFLIELQGGDVPAVSAASLTNKLLQLSSGAVYDEDGVTRVLHDEKIHALRKLVAKINGNVLIACAYKHEQQRILEALRGAEMFSEDRLGAWNRGEIPVWVADYRSISHGLNLQEGGCDVIWFTPTYSFESYEQFNARLARTGQEHVTTIYRLLAEDTIDDAVVEALRMKKEGQGGLIASLKVLEYMRAT